MSTTILTLMAKDKEVHGLNMQADYDKFICANHTTRKLFLKSRKDMYMCNGLNRNITFVPLMSNIPVDPVTGVQRSKTVSTPNASITTYPKPDVEASCDLYSALISGLIIDSPDTTLSLDAVQALALKSGGVIGLSQADSDSPISTNSGSWISSSLQHTKVSSPSSVPSSVPANEKLSKLREWCTDIFRFEGEWGWAPPNSGSHRLGMEIGFRITRYPPVVTPQPDTVVTTTWIEYTVSDTNFNLPLQWSYDLTKIVSANEKVVSFLAYIEASDSAIGQLLVGYDADPSIVVGTCTVSGKKDTSIPEKKYYSDSKRGVFVDIPVRDGTKKVNIKYLNGETNPQKTYAYVYGYAKTKDLRFYDSRFSYSMPVMTDGEFTGTTLNTMTTYETTGGEIISDTPDTSGECHALLQYAFTLPADADKFAKLYITGEIYVERASLNGVWKSFKYVLEPTSKANFSIYREEFVGDDDIRYNRWTVAVSKYGYGLSVHAGIRNVMVQI